MNGLGRRQRNMLVNMRLHGRNHWPESWRLRGEDRDVLETLQVRGLVTANTRHASLTNTGEQIAAQLVSAMSDRTWKESKLRNELRSEIA